MATKNMTNKSKLKTMALLSCGIMAAGAAYGEAACLTAAPQADGQLLYFTSTSLLADDQHLVFLSDRTGQPNIFVRDLKMGQDRQLTTNKEGFLKSYVYFDGLPYRGLGKASVSVDPQRGIVYYIQGRQIRAVNTNGVERVLAEYPAGQMTAFTHVSADGARLCVPTTDARALDGDALLKGKPAYDIDERVRQESLSSYLRVYDTASGKEISCERVPKAWITHVQFSPRDSNLILYNHEWSADCGINRMWLWDGHRHLRLRTEGAGRSRSDWTCHEMWERDGSAIIYHGGYAKGASYIGRVNSDGTGLVEIALPAAWKRYGHFTVGSPGWLVSDGCYEQSDDSPGGGAWISVLQVNWQSKHYDWWPLCRHGSSWRSQDAHPHPIYNHAADAVYFTSDKTGKLAVCRVGVPGDNEPHAAERVTVGAIRWDAWFADAVNPYEKNLSDKKWHGRLPFYAKIISDTEVEVRGDTQEAVDKEIAYAKNGGIDYWAFLYYSPTTRSDGFKHDYMNRARRLYLSSKRKGDIHFCLIVNPKNQDKEINEWLDMMREPTYQKVAGGRPLLYFMFWDSSTKVEQIYGSAEKGRAYMDKLRERIMQAGFKNPYFVTLSPTPQIGAAAAEGTGLDAIGAYTSWGGTNYAGLCAAHIKHWDAMKATGLKVVPDLAAGWGGPRDNKGDTMQPKPGELASHVRSAFEWITANPDAAEAKTMLFYAWNEVDEGGWLVPDKGQGTAKLDAIHGVVTERTPLK